MNEPLPDVLVGGVGEHTEAEQEDVCVRVGKRSQSVKKGNMKDTMEQFS